MEKEEDEDGIGGGERTGRSERGWKGKEEKEGEGRKKKKRKKGGEDGGVGTK